MMSPPDGKPEPTNLDPAQIEKLLELELAQKRAGWQQAKARRSHMRLFSFLFLFLIIVGSLLAFFFLFSPDRAQELKSNAAPGASPLASPGHRP